MLSSLRQKMFFDVDSNGDTKVAASEKKHRKPKSKKEEKAIEHGIEMTEQKDKSKKKKSKRD